MNKFDRLLSEAVNGLPETHDPYLGSNRPDVRMGNGDKSLFSGEGDVDQLPDHGTSSAKDQPLKLGEQEQENSGDEFNEVDEAEAPVEQAPQEVQAEPQKPAGPVWERIKLPNKKDLGYRRSDGFIMRIRKIESVPGRYVAQILSGKKILDKGFVDVPETYDPVLYVQSMCDAMLDDNSEREEEMIPPPQDEMVMEPSIPGEVAPQEQDELIEPGEVEGKVAPPQEQEDELPSIELEDGDFEITQDDVDKVQNP